MTTRLLIALVLMVSTGFLIVSTGFALGQQSHALNLRGDRFEP